MTDTESWRETAKHREDRGREIEREREREREQSGQIYIERENGRVKKIYRAGESRLDQRELRD